MQHSLNELPSTQHLSSTPTKSRENDITKYESISLNELTPTSTNKSIQKHKSTNKDNEPSLIKKYSSIQITPKHNNNNPQYIHFNLEDLSSSSKKNSNKKRIQYASTISNFPKAAKKKDTVSPNKTANKQKKQTHNNSRSSNSQSRTHSNTINMKFITFHDINSHSNNKNKISSSNINNTNKEGKKDNKHNNVTTSPGKERSNTNRNRNSGANKNNQQNTSKRKKKVVSINIDVVENICNSNINSNNNNSAGIKCEKSKSSINIQKNLSHTEGNNNNNSNTKDKKDKSIVESKHKHKKHKHTTNTNNTNNNTTTVPYLSTAPNQQPKSTSHKDKDKKNNNTTTNNNNNVDFLNTIPKPTNQKCATFFSNRKSHNTQQTHQNCLTNTNSNNNFITNNKSGLNNSLTNSNTTNIKHHNTISTSTKATITNTASCNNLNKKNKLSFSSSMQINTFKQKMKIKVNRKDTNNESKDIINPKSNSNSNTLTKTSNKKTTLLTTSITPASNQENSSTKKHPKKQPTLTQQQLLSKGIPPKQIIQRYHKYLTHYELKELSKFKSQVYYLGEISKRKHNTYINLNKSFTHVNTKIRPITPMHKHNKSFSYSTTPSYLYTSMHPPFDDKEGDYIIKKGNQLNYRYELLCSLGKGSYGEAIKCYDHKTNEYVCIKIIKSHSKFYHQAIIEVNILEYISSHDTNSETNCVRFYTHFTFRNHICLVFELLDVNLYEYLKLNDYNGFNIKRIRSYTIEILFALLFLRKHKIIHCDLKPENILLLKNNKNNVKVIDFGSSCFDKEKLYFYIQSRFYRAPEIILELEYSMQIDMWSLGCILCELYTGQPIFPGEDERDQLNYIMEYLDVPPTEYINASRKRRVFFDNNNIPLKVQNSQGHIAVPNTKSLNNTLKGSGQHFIDFIKECLKWNPNERITPENALMHKFIISDMNYETLYQHKIKINRMKIGMGRNVIKSAKSSLNSNRSSNYSISKQNKNEGKRNINNNNNGNSSNSNNNTIDKKKISVSIDKEYNKDKEKLNKIEELGVEGIQQSRSVDKKTWGFKDKEEDEKEKKGSKCSKGKKDGKECNEKSSKMDCKGNNNGKVKNSLKQG